MQNEKTFISEFLENLKKEDVDIHLYFVTRHLKEGIKTREKVLDKYDFRLQKIDMSRDLQVYFQNVLINQLETSLKKEDLEIIEYSIIGDDLKNKLYTYALNNALSFSDVIINQLPNATDIKNVESLKAIKKFLWAYCIKVTIDSQESYTFRKISEGKVATGDPQNLKEKLLSYFDTEEADLKQLKNEVISFDDKVDCLYLNEKFYIFSTGNFETILCLEEEYKANADDVITTLEKTNLIEGINLLKDEIKTNKNHLKMLANISRKQNHKNFNNQEIEKMRNVWRKMLGEELKVTNQNKIKIENTQDIKGFLKLLNDFYKQGLVTDKYYGTNSGTILKPANT